MVTTIGVERWAWPTRCTILSQTNWLRLRITASTWKRPPPTHEVEITERTAWSCAHGVERLAQQLRLQHRPGLESGVRRPRLRETLDRLRESLGLRYEQKAGNFLKHPWEARDAYISVVLDRSPENFQSFLARHALRQLSQPEETVVLKLLEMQRHAMLMYTSCGWFFDELSGIETVQILQYAGRAIQLARGNLWRVNGTDVC